MEQDGGECVPSVFLVIPLGLMKTTRDIIQVVTLVTLLFCLPVGGIWLLRSSCCKSLLEGNEFVSVAILLLVLGSPLWVLVLFGRIYNLCGKWFSNRKYRNLISQLTRLPQGERQLKIKTLSPSEREACQEILSTSKKDPEKIWLELHKANWEENEEGNKLFWEKSDVWLQETRTVNDAAYAKGLAELDKELMATGWRVEILSPEQGRAFGPAGEAYTWISQNISQTPWEHIHKDIRWHPDCNPPEAVKKWILYVCPEEGYKAFHKQLADGHKAFLAHLDRLRRESNPSGSTQSQ